MDIEQARTFLAIAAHGSLLEAASQLHVTQSRVSARVQHLSPILAPDCSYVIAPAPR